MSLNCVDKKPGHIEAKSPADFTNDEIAEAARRTAAACAEAGYPVEFYCDSLFDLRNPRSKPRVPCPVFCKARALAFDSMGIEYEVIA